MDVIKLTRAPSRHATDMDNSMYIRGSVLINDEVTIRTLYAQVQIANLVSFEVFEDPTELPKLND